MCRHASIRQVNLSDLWDFEEIYPTLFTSRFTIAAPENKDTIVILMPISHIAPNNANRIDELVSSARAKIIKIIEARLKISNFEELIETELINDPRTWQTKFNLWKGSILGLSHNITQVLHMRPGTRSHLFKNLYFVGASAHPGTGVPVVLCGSKLVEKQIMEDVGMIERTDDTAIIFMQYIAFAICIAAIVYILSRCELFELLV